MRARDLACAAFGWALAAAVWLGASRLQRSLLSDDFGADGMPRGLALALAIVSTLIAVRAFWRPGAAPPGAEVAPREHLKAAGVVALGFGYVLLAPWSGYMPAAFLLIAAATLYYGARPSLTLFAVSAAGAAFLWWIFAKVLSVSMPTPAWSRLLG